MTAKLNGLQEFQAEANKLRGERLTLQREVTDQVAQQQRVYDEVLKPNSADAKVMSAGLKADRPLSVEVAKLIENVATPTARFEWARAEIARISALVTRKRKRLKAVEERLMAVRETIGRLEKGEDLGSGSMPGASGEASGPNHGTAALSGGLGERLDALRSRTSLTRSGDGVLS